MTREELGITDEGEAYINAIIARGAVEQHLRFPRDERDVPRLRENLTHARQQVDATREALRHVMGLH